MADLKITQLTELAAAPDNADILAIVDDVAVTPITKKITVANLLAGKQNLLTNSAGLLAALSDETGTGLAVFNTSPTLVTPALGTPASGALTNCTFPTLNQNTTGSSGSCTGNSATVTTNANLTGVVTSVGNATAIADKAIATAKLADGTDGELITWDAAGVIAKVAVGTVDQVLTSGGAGVAPTFQDAAGGGFPWTYWFWDDFDGKVIDTTNRWTTVLTGGIVTRHDGFSGTLGAAYFSTGATADNIASMKLPAADGGVLDFGTILPTLIMRGRHNADYTKVQELLQLGASIDGTIVVAAKSGVCFRHDVTTAAGNWFAVSSDGTTLVSTDTGIAAGNTAQNLKIVYESATSVKFYIDGVLKATHTANNPAVGDDFMPLIYIKTKEAVEKKFVLDYVKVLSTVSRGTE